MLIHDTKEVYRRKVETAVGEDASAEDVLDYLFGKYGERREANFVIREWIKPTQNRVQRINTVWVCLLTIFLAPVRYIIYGQVRWSDKTRFGKWLLKITGNMKEIN
jgi:hypothetical protein